MSDTPTNHHGDGERTNLAPILAPIITLFIGFGAGVVFSEFIPLGKTPAIQAAPGATPGGERAPERQPTPSQIDDETRRALEDAAAQGDESAREALENADPPADPPPSDGAPGDG